VGDASRLTVHVLGD